jgi:hypothetical protein
MICRPAICVATQLGKLNARSGRHRSALPFKASLGACLLLAAMLAQPPPAAATRADAVVLVNSTSAAYLDFQHFVQPYLDNFGVPYTVQDIASNPPAAALTNYALILLGHRQLDTNQTYLNAAAQAALSLAVSNGTGLVSFDTDLSSGTAPRYQFVQNIFGFSYGPGMTVSNVNFPPTEPGAQMHFITARHVMNDLVAFRSSINLPGLTVPTNATALVLSGGRPLVAIAKYGQGRAVQWSSYDWMVSTVLGPIDGLDDVVWRGTVWAARKPFVMRGLPSFVTMRVDDASGPFGWVHAANAVVFKPFLALFYKLVADSSAADLQALTTSGNATASIHSLDYGNAFFYFNHATEQPWPDDVQSNNFYLGTQWHTSHGIPISKVVIAHYNEVGLNCFAGLKAWGVEFFPSEVVPGAIQFATPGAPWLIGAPYRLYETPQQAQVNWPAYYADWLAIPSHPEFDGQFFNYACEIRDVNSCGEWCPDNYDLPGSIARGTQMVKRCLDSMVMPCAYTHEWYISPISATNWQTILQGITNNLAPYAPIYVTLDFASQYVRATRTSRLLAGDYQPSSGLLTLTLSGQTDLDTSVYVFNGADSSISSSLVTVPAFVSVPLTNMVTTLSGRPAAPVIVAPPASLTNLAGSTATLSVGVSGTTPLNYQWLQNGLLLTNAGNLLGAYTPNLTLSNLTAANAGNYAVAVANLAGSITSPVATVTVVVPPQLAGATLLPDKTFQFALTATSNLTYRIDASTDLLTWTPLTNLSDPAGTVQFTDPAATHFPRRFYRGVWVP